MIHFKPLLIASLLMLLSTLLYGCKEASNKAPAEVAKKYGAAVQFTHSYDGSSNIDQAEYFELTFQPTQIIDTISIELRSPDDILLGGDQTLTPGVSNSSPVTIPVGILARSEGKFYINIVVQTEQEGRRLGRAYAVAIKVGSAPTAQKIAPNKDNNVHIMPGQEDIR